ncbi:unnamed protein product [Acanthoscelides obtectus]|uniref:Uncharacterized protein n=1 Tax=Acanthoscelides obtectus TaxID=200917 RepID=A0A9P0QJ75_ACAOB|nr:unnamed protein product [Acanthoscelides obtectus]CAK1685528.1 hypothetical protein AOBTE_LOCUS35483 [Acanthoscelides obtectus]
MNCLDLVEIAAAVLAIQFFTLTTCYQNEPVVVADQIFNIEDGVFYLYELHNYGITELKSYPAFYYSGKKFPSTQKLKIHPIEQLDM